MDAYKTTYHRDGTVTFWDVFRQTWRREAAKEVARWADVMASLSHKERDRINRMAARS